MNSHIIFFLFSGVWFLGFLSLRLLWTDDMTHEEKEKAVAKALLWPCFIIRFMMRFFIIGVKCLFKGE